MPFIHSVLSGAIVHTCGTRHAIHSFYLSQCQPFIHVAPDMPSIHSVLASAISSHAAPDMPFIHSVLASAIPLYTPHQTCHTFILSYPVPLFIPAAPDMPSIHSVLASAIPLYTRPQICHPFILSYPVPSFIHAAPDMSSIHSVLASANPLYKRHQTCHPFILSYQVQSLYIRGTRHAIHSFCLSQFHSFIHAAPDMPSIHSV